MTPTPYYILHTTYTYTLHPLLPADGRHGLSPSVRPSVRLPRGWTALRRLFYVRIQADQLFYINNQQQSEQAHHQPVGKHSCQRGCAAETFTGTWYKRKQVDANVARTHAHCIDHCPQVRVSKPAYKLTCTRTLLVRVPRK